MLEDDQDVSGPCEAVRLAKLSLLSKVKAGGSSTTSTPLPGHLTVLSRLDLTPVHPLTSRSLLRIQEEESPLVCRKPTGRQVAAPNDQSIASRLKVSDDMFGDEGSDEEMFNKIVSNIVEKGESSKISSKSVFS